MDHKLTLEQSLLRTANLKKAAATRLRTRARNTGNITAALGLNRKREKRLDSRKRDYDLMMSNATGRAYKASAGTFHRPGSFN
jgi:hypothetical protein